MKKKLIIVFAVLIILFAAVFLIFRKNTVRIERRAQLEQKDIEVEFRLTGEVIPRNRIEIKSQISGRIENILVKEGDRVKKGQTLVLMSSSERASMLDVARSMGEAEYKKWQEIYREAPISAPMNGFIILRDKEPGQTVGVSDVILAMADDLIVDANVDETDLKYMKIGQLLKMRLDAYPDIEFGGVVEHIAYESKVVSNVTVYTIRIKPKNPPKFFRSGMTATITVEIDNKKSVWAIPSEFINTIGGEHIVLVLDDKNLRSKNDNQAKKDNDEQAKRPERKINSEIKTRDGNVVSKKVDVGISDGKWTEILSGLDRDDTVVIIGTRKENAQKQPMRNVR
ncbi:MAG: efflux RND transporter periplasmic adaptor subunit [Elusimicrobiota bacterium]|jgi:macrolide-specific efflux system membrane fusion protein|nr:efflux RND transporter periplasmic adaptor subunit [Elusimicrobiota bacterium]